MTSSWEENVALLDSKWKKYVKLNKTEDQLDKKISQMKKELGLASKTYVAELNIYNETKDAAQTILGALATLKNMSVEEVHRDYDLPVTDKKD